MRLIKKLSLVFLTMILVLSFTGTVFANGSDIDGHWAENKIRTWLDDGTIEGYPDNTFRPDKYMTRAEFITLINNVFDYRDSEENFFKDVDPLAWYAQEVSRAIFQNYISGYEDGTFRPSNLISRQEAAVIIAKILQLEASDSSDWLSKFADEQDIPQWSRGAINALVGKKIMNGYSDGTIKPNNYITRAEVVVILQQAIKGVVDGQDPIVDEETSDENKLPSIKSLSGSNGIVEMQFSSDVVDLTLDDFEISAKLDGETYQLNNLIFNAEKTPLVSP